MNHKFFHQSSNLLSWDEIFSFLATLSELNEVQAAREYGAKNIKPDITYTMMLLQLEDFPQYNERIQSLYQSLGIEEFKQQKINNGYKPDCGIYMSIIPKAKSHGIHRDVTDVFHWQQQGKTTFTIYDDKPYTYVLKPGDCVFIPAGMYHNTLPLTARAGVSFAFFPDDYEGEWTEDYFKKKGINPPYYDPFPKNIFNL